MEISFEEPPEPLQSNKKFAVLKRIDNQSFYSSLPTGQKLRPDYYDALSSPASVRDENKRFREETSQAYNSHRLKSNSNSSDCTKNSNKRSDCMHNQLKKPDYTQISHIYENYIRSPDITQKPMQNKKNTRQASAVSRPASAPLTRKNILNDLIKEREKEFKENCTFKPQINKSYNSKQADYQDSQSHLTLKQRILKLSRPKSEQIEKREKLKREIEDQKYSECTFQPMVTRFNYINRNLNEPRVDQRLYQDAESKFYEREKIRRQSEEEVALNYPFKPQVQATVSKLVGNKRERPPIYLRLQQLQQEINQNRDNIRLRAEIDHPDLTFKPNINPNSYQLAYIKKNREKMHSNEIYSSKSRSDYNKYEEKYASAPHASTFYSTNPNKPFLERQEIFKEKSITKRQEIIESLEKKSWNFTPEIGKASKFIAESDKNRYSTTIEKRLMKTSQDTKALKADFEEKYYSEFKFEPKINSISKNLGKSTSLNEIATNLFSKALKNKLAEEKLAEEESKYNYKPKISKSKDFEYISSTYKQIDNLTQTLKRQQSIKERRIEEIKKYKESQEMRECTFTPQKIEAKDFSKSVSIKGMDRFFELKDMARRKEQEHRERENKAFSNPSRKNYESFYTIPKPFNLHPSNKKEKIQKIKSEIEEKEKTECVFKPQLTD
jgi:hypothetical protein